VSTKAHIPELDSLRALAVGLVFVQHWNVFGLEHLYTGGWGVRIFFVLSGFLITGILLKSREAIERGEPIQQELKTFYIRRTLRIFPVYYLVLALVSLLALPGIREVLHWHVLYGSNILYAMRGWPQTGAHLWSLAVEEQFYLVWPLTMFLLPRRLIPVTIALLIAFAPIFRYVVRASGGGHIAAMALTPGCLDALGMGALLAFALHTNINTSKWSLPLLVASLPLVKIDLELATALFGAGIINLVVTNSGSKATGILRLKPLRYLGTISYGLYLYHLFIYQVLAQWVPAFPGKLILYAGATIAISALSWEIFEKPILQLKNRFSYRRAYA